MQQDKILVTTYYYKLFPLLLVNIQDIILHPIPLLANAPLLAIVSGLYPVRMFVFFILFLCVR